MHAIYALPCISSTNPHESGSEMHGISDYPCKTKRKDKIMKSTIITADDVRRAYDALRNDASDENRKAPTAARYG